MDYIDNAVALKEKLIIAGIDEIKTNGISGLSLRKVAASCGASCAAPYKHFKNKEDFIEQIISYVEDKWLLLGNQIIASVDDPVERIARLCTANVHFKIANPLYGLTVSKNRLIANELKKYCATEGLSEDNTQIILFTIRVLTGGTATLIEKGSLENTPETFELLHKKIVSELK